MAEFVEQSLEKLLPCFEEIKLVQLFSDQEVAEFIKRCRRLDYRLAKRKKEQDDFINYASYLQDVLALLKVRRKKQGYELRHKRIECPLREKVAELYRRCCFRFQGDLKLWRAAIDFLKSTPLKNETSKLFVRALQVHGRSAQLRVDAAEWEFFHNKSVENARVHLQQAIRWQPKERSFWVSLFRVEVHFVKRILKRKEFLEAKRHGDKTTEEEEEEHEFEGADEPVTDAVLQLKLADIVVKNAAQNLSKEDNQMARLEMWRTAVAQKEIAARLEKELYELLWSDPCEEAWLAKIEKMAAEGEDTYELFDAAIVEMPTEKMHRLYLERCQDKDGKQDPFLAMKRVHILRELCAKGFGGEADLSAAVHAVAGDELECAERKRELVEAALKSNPKSGAFWTELVRLEIAGVEEGEKEEEPASKRRKNGGDEVKEEGERREKVHKVLETFNTAIEKVCAEETLDLWRLAIDFSIQHVPSAVEQVFARGMVSTCPSVSSAIKCIRLDYVDTAGDVERSRRETRAMAACKPNEPSFYMHAARVECERKEPDQELVNELWETAVAEHSRDSVDAWVGYLDWLMLNRPDKVAAVYQRAMLMLERDLNTEFVTRWTKLHQKAAEQK